MKKNAKQIIIAAVALVLLLVAAFVIKTVFSADTTSGDKTITFTVVHGDGSEKEYKIETDREYLGDAVYDEKLVTEDEYKAGFYTVIDGETADYNADGAWWCIKQDGEMTTVGMNELPIEDGDGFDAIYTIG